MTISAKIIADSVAPNGIRITTFELEYPRFIHAEFMTHRLFSRNAASSRAIPVKKAIELIIADTAKPIHWGKNQPGMSAKEECDSIVQCLQDGHVLHLTRERAWEHSMLNAVAHAEAFDKAGYHKQIVNRMLEPYSHIKVVLTATEYDNFFYLRKHPDAQPEIQRLAEVMWEEYSKNIPYALDEDKWHTPYYGNGYWEKDSMRDDGKDHNGYTLEDALIISSSCCAQVSYRKTDDSLEKARDIYERLVASKPVHASPFEHQATPIRYGEVGDVPAGVTHFTVISGFHELNGTPIDAWSGNFRGWIQHRQLIKDNVCWSYTE